MKLQDKIKESFANVKLGDGISLRQAEVMDNYGEGVTAEQFRNIKKLDESEDWTGVTASDFRARPSLAQLDPMGFRFYLPAAMHLMLESSEFSDSCVNSLCVVLNPAQNGGIVDHFELLSRKQREVVAEFLLFAAKNPSSTRLDRQYFQEAIDVFWNDYIS